MALTQNYLKEFKERYGLDKDHFWQHKQSGQWIVTHDGVTIAAHKEGITWTVENWTPPVSDPARVMVKVVATKKDTPPVEMIGECEVQAKGITKMYPFSMALKRGVDRAILAILAPGGGLYSQVETEEWDADGRARAASSNKKLKPDVPQENPIPQAGAWKEHMIASGKTPEEVASEWKIAVMVASNGETDKWKELDTSQLALLNKIIKEDVELPGIASSDK